MVRECAVLLIAATCPACSLILDFSDSAAPIDAAIDTVYTQAECDYKEPNESVTSPATVTTTDTGPAAICAAQAGSPEDHDFYQFTVSGQAMVTLKVQFTNRPGGDLDLKLYDASGTMLAQSRGFGDGEMIVCPGNSPSCPTLADGNYVIEVFPAVTGSVNSYTFSISN